MSSIDKIVRPDDTMPGNSDILYRIIAGDVFACSADNLSNNDGISDESAIANGWTTSYNYALQQNIPEL